MPPWSQAAQTAPPADGQERDESVIRSALDAALEMRQEALDPEQLELEGEHERIERGPPARLRLPDVERLEEPRQGEEGAVVPLLLGVEAEHRLEPDEPGLQPVRVRADSRRATGRARRR